MVDLWSYVGIKCARQRQGTLGAEELYHNSCVEHDMLSCVDQHKLHQQDLKVPCGACSLSAYISTRDSVHTGVVQPMEEIGKMCRENKVFFHTDGAQAVGKVPVDVNASNIDLMSISAHKIYGPKGIGAIYVRRRPRVRLEAQMSGGGQVGFSTQHAQHAKLYSPCDGVSRAAAGRALVCWSWPQRLLGQLRDPCAQGAYSGFAGARGVSTRMP